MSTSAPRSRCRRIASALLASLVTVAGLLVMAEAPAAADNACDERGFYDLVNNSRAANGLGGLSYDAAASSVARGWSQYMAGTGVLQHNPNLVGQVNVSVTTQWTRLAENVGVGWSVSSLHDGFMNSPGHRANILGQYNRLGVGVARGGDGRIWVTEVFVYGPGISNTPPSCTPPPPPPQEINWLLRNSNSSGAPSLTARFGMSNYNIVTGDWDGNGTDTIGVYVNGNWYLRNSNSAGAPNIVVSYGYAGAIPVVGDWDGNGTDTIGVYDSGTWYLRNSNSAGAPNAIVTYGYRGAIPVVGDWDGNGSDTIGVYDSGTWLMRNSNWPGYPDIQVGYGAAGYRPAVGDWDGNGTATLGVVV